LLSEAKHLLWPKPFAFYRVIVSFDARKYRTRRYRLSATLATM